MAYELEWNVMRDIYDDEIPEFIKKAFSTLSPREKEVLKWRHVDHLTLDKTAKIYGVTRGRISQIEKKAVRKIRHSITIYDKNARIGELDADDDIDFLRFSVRTRNCLKRGGIHSITKLVSLSYEKLSETKNIGPKAIDEINEKLVQSGFKPIVNEEEN